MEFNPENLASSIVREYLNKKKCLKTLQLLDEEWPRNENSINSRAKLAQALHIENWIAKNKSAVAPLKTMLEIILFNVVNLGAPQPSSIESPQTEKSFSSAYNTHSSFGSSHHKARPHTALGTDRHRSGKPHEHADHGKLKDVPFSHSEEVLCDVEISDHEIAEAPRGVRLSNTTFMLQSQHQKLDVNEDYLSGNTVHQKTKETSRNQFQDQTLNFDFTSLDELLHDVPKKATIPPSYLPTSEASSAYRPNLGKPQTVFQKNNAFSKPMPVQDIAFDYDVAKDLRKLIFGNTKSSFSSEWCDQSFAFCDCNDRPKELRFGIVQKKGGPCGVLASLQAIVLKYMLFSNQNALQPELLNVSDALRTSCLVDAICEILWRAGDSIRATLAILSPRKQFTGLSHEYRPDGITEYVSTLNFASKKNLHSAIQQNVNLYELGKGSCILLLYSAILSRGIDFVRKDMDEQGGKLMGAHNYCTQEMVNLLVVGRATSNAFNNTVKLDETTILKGIYTQSDVGLLSLFEHYKSCEIGDFYKTPKYPIWIICSESHFTVLFGLDLNLLSKINSPSVFDLYYYDGLANQDEVIRLTVDTTVKPPDAELNNDLVPPLEHCIRTKWARAFIDWNGSDPLL